MIEKLQEFLPWFWFWLDIAKCLICFGITVYWAYFLAKARDERREWWETAEDLEPSTEYMQHSAWRR